MAGVVLPAMPPRNARGGSAPQLTLPHGDLSAVELTSAIHGGDLDAVRRLLAERPELASVHMIGRNGREGGWRTPLHAATDWPGYFPAAPVAVALLLEAGADPNDDCGGDRPETPLHWAASTDDVEVAVALIDGGADLETPGGRSAPPSTTRSATPAGTSPGSWSPEAPRSTSSGTQRRSGWSSGWSNSSRSGLTRPASCPRRSGMPAPAANDALRSTCSLEGLISTGFPTTRRALPWTQKFSGHPPGKPRRLAAGARRQLSEAPGPT